MSSHLKSLGNCAFPLTEHLNAMSIFFLFGVIDLSSSLILITITVVQYLYTIIKLYLFYSTSYYLSENQRIMIVLKSILLPEFGPANLGLRIDTKYQLWKSFYYIRLFVLTDVILETSDKLGYLFYFVYILILLQILMIALVFLDANRNLNSRIQYAGEENSQQQRFVGSVMIFLIVIRCPDSSFYYLLLVLLCFKLLEFGLFYLSANNKVEIQSRDTLSFFMYSHLLNTVDFQDMQAAEPHLKIKLTSYSSLIALVVKTTLSILFTLFFSEKRPYLWLIVFNIELIVILCLVLKDSKTVIVAERLFDSPREILPLLQRYKKYELVLIKKPERKQFDSENLYYHLQEKSDSNDFELTTQEQMELLDYLRQQSSKQRIQIQQYHITVGPNSFIVNKVVNMKTLFNQLTLVHQIPSCYLPPCKYLSLDITQLIMERALLLKTSDRQVLPFYYTNSKQYKQLFQFSFQIQSFLKNVGQYLNLNPSQVLYDLYEN